MCFALSWINFINVQGFFNLYQENWYSDEISIVGFKMVFSDNSNEIMVKKLYLLLWTSGKNAQHRFLYKTCTKLPPGKSGAFKSS